MIDIPAAMAAAIGSMVSDMNIFLSSGESMIRILVKMTVSNKTHIILLRTDFVPIEFFFFFSFLLAIALSHYLFDIGSFILKRFYPDIDRRTLKS